jgi:hypothetical protein
LELRLHVFLKLLPAAGAHPKSAFTRDHAVCQPRFRHSSQFLESGDQRRENEGINHLQGSHRAEARERAKPSHGTIALRGTVTPEGDGACTAVDYGYSLALGPAADGRLAAARAPTWRRPVSGKW